MSLKGEPQNSSGVLECVGASTRGYVLPSQRERPLEYWSFTPLGNQASQNDLRVCRVLSEVTSEQYARESRQEMQAQRNGGGGRMGSLAEELEKVKVQLRGRKPPPAPGRLVIHREIGPGLSAQDRPRKWRL
ncbi:hypothetical protein PEBR_16118 [Penicillium brasilianum]|uniref:Uncharacterized protein n=1 Tax=Penicillium brasilianum TaxID=104259 RepID=A0A1S9RQ92_PENBI|nr:hypothetical protein PEBR_16118 [Penicillium brasilianum]